MSTPSVIMLEFNELTPALIHRFMDAGELPHFTHFFREARIFTTDAEEDPHRLEPWVQWVTVHSGLPYDQHRIFYLDEGHTLKEKCLWDFVSHAGRPVWVCGSMNVRYDIPLHGALVPDPWSSGLTPFPSELMRYHQFVRHQVQEHTNDEVGLAVGEYLRFLSFMAGHGLSFTTLLAIVRQLIEEQSHHCRWKRTTLLDTLQWDLFAWYYRRLRPGFATFFSNSVAHLQHMYWREMEPWHFRVKPSAREQADYEGAILHGYHAMDALMRRFMTLADDHTTLIFCTALSQQPCVAYEEQGGKCFYRPRQFDQVMDLAGVHRGYSVSSVMSEQFQVQFDSEEDALRAASRLDKLHVNRLGLIGIDARGSSLRVGCAIHTQLDRDAVISYGADKKCAFFKVFYQAESLKSGMHHGDGLLWIRQPDRVHSVHAAKVSLRAIAPTVLSLLDLDIPDSMTVPPLIPLAQPDRRAA